MKCLPRLACLAIALLASAVFAQETPKPGPEHDLLKQFAGEWDAAMKCTSPTGETVESKGTYSAKMEVAGLFLVTEFKATLMGTPFFGRGINGYDPAKKKFTGVWVDSMSPAIYTTTGEFDKAGKVLTETMEGPGPDGKAMKFRLVNEVKDQDHVNFKIFMAGEDGKEMKMMETEYTRKK